MNHKTKNFVYNWDDICNISDEDIVQANIEGKPICLEMENFAYFKIDKLLSLPGNMQLLKVLKHLTKTKLCCQLSANEYKSLADVDVVHNDDVFPIIKKNEVFDPNTESQ